MRQTEYPQEPESEAYLRERVRVMGDVIRDLRLHVRALEDAATQRWFNACDQQDEYRDVEDHDRDE